MAKFKKAVEGEVSTGGVVETKSARGVWTVKWGEREVAHGSRELAQRGVDAALKGSADGVEVVMEGPGFERRYVKAGRVVTKTIVK